MDRKELSELTEHYKMYYTKEIRTTLEEYTLMMFLFGMYNSLAKKDVSFDEYLQKLRMNFESSNKKNFHHCTYNTFNS
jgi:hypothetical protein